MLQVIKLLRGPTAWNARKLAEHFGTTRRNIYRDLAILELAGIPYFFDQDFGDTGGYRIRPEWWFPPLGDGINFECYAARAIRYKVLDGFRRQKANRAEIVKFNDPTSLPDRSYLVDDELIAAERIDEVKKWLGALDRSDRMMLTALYYEGVTQADIARQRGTTPARVSQIHRALLEAARVYLGPNFQLN